MGWWSISDKENDRESDRESELDMVNGDTPADIMGDAIEEIVKTYQAVWNRKPYRKELEAVFKFTASLPQYYTEVGDARRS
jgi:hypothetical protein